MILIPDYYQVACEETILGELKYLGPERIHGLGITLKTLMAWKKTVVARR